MSVADELDGWAWPVVPEGPPLVAERDASGWLVTSEGPTVAAELDGWTGPVVPE